MLSPNRWSLWTGSIILKYNTCQENVLFHDRLSLMAVISKKVSLQHMYIYRAFTDLKWHYVVFEIHHQVHKEDNNILK